MYSDYTALFSYKNGRKIIKYSEFPYYLSNDADKLTEAAIALFDSYIKLHSTVSLADFGVYYSSKAL